MNAEGDASHTSVATVAGTAINAKKTCVLNASGSLLGFHVMCLTALLVCK